MMNHSLDNTYAIILAAGNSSRFGPPKQLANWQDSNLIQHTLQLAQALFNERVIIVLGAHAAEIEQNLDQQSVNIVHNAHWQQGMSTSIRTGINALPENADSAMLMLCDQPLIDISSLRQLTTLWQQHPDSIVASEYQGTVGVPVLFPASIFAELKELSGDAGAKRILNERQDEVLTIPLPEAGTDIDTQKDLNNLMVHLKTKSVEL